MVKSIRLRLLIWYAAVLAVVVGGFTLLLYYEVQAARFREIDAQLETGSAGLESALRMFPPHELNGSAPPFPPKGPPPKGPPQKGPNGAPPPPEPMTQERLLASLNLPGPPGDQTVGTYYAVWRADGTLLKSSRLPPDTGKPANLPAKPAIVFRGTNRERAVRGPQGVVILVGRPAESAFAELAAFAWQLLVMGVFVMVVALVGGWIISRRIFRPVEVISATAARISVANLSERIDTEPLDKELVELGRVLNDTFDRLEASFARQAQFTADASHELRTPLTVIRSQAELALLRPREPEEYRASLESCLKAAERMSALVERLLALARADAGMPGLMRKSVDLDRIIEDAAGQLHPAARSKKVTVVRDLTPVQVIGDGPALGQVALNLIANAVKYNRSGGRVWVKLIADRNQAILTVEDTGIGIPEADRTKVFERFYRADKARTRASGGMGLGLAICKAIIEAHGGTIEFETLLGQGTTFRVSLPRHLESAVAVPDRIERDTTS